MLLDLFYPEDGGKRFCRHVGKFVANYAASHTIKQSASLLVSHHKINDKLYLI